MPTFFTTAKPFRDHDGIIQRNELESWTLLHSDVEVILFGNEEGAAEAAKELGLHHEPHVERNEFGTKRMDFMFCRAQAFAQHDLLCYINCDILLMEDFCDAREASALFDGGTPMGHRSHGVVQSWRQGLGEALAPTSLAERTAARAGVD